MGKGIPLATFGALGALGAGGAGAVQTAPAPAVPQAANSVNVDSPIPVNVDLSSDPSAPVARVRKARVTGDGVVMDTGVGEHMTATGTGGCWRASGRALCAPAATGCLTLSGQVHRPDRETLH